MHNVPCVLEGLACTWPAYSRWDFAFLSSYCKDDEVMLMLDGDRSHGAREHTTVGEYLCAFDSLRPTDTHSGWVPYLREWSFAKRHPELLEDIAPAADTFADGFQSPQIPSGDRPELTWLFVGPAGAYTPLHRDLWHTDAWIAQLRGRKLVRLWHPMHTNALSHGDVFCDLSCPDLDTFPESQAVPCSEAILEPGDVLYVPADWLHEVISLEDSVSVSSNFMARGAEARVLPHHQEWLARRWVSREIAATQRRLRLLASLEDLTQTEEEDGMIYELNDAQKVALKEKPSLQQKLLALQTLPNLGSWKQTTL